MVERKIEPEVESILSLVRNKKHFLLSGGAGCGKTYSLVSLLKEIAREEPNARIACITYTNAAALEIKNRVNTKNLHVSTIHDFLWMNISQFQNELRELLIEMVNAPENVIVNPSEDEDFSLDSEVQIKYKEHTRLAQGEISHDELIKLSNAMFKQYTKLCKVVSSKYNYIFVDEYQDTSSMVIEILLNSLQRVSNPSTIGFFGDSMQAIYDDGVGDIDDYVTSGVVVKVEKKQNRRNPRKIIDLGNNLRTDGLIQEPSKDIDAPNMKDGKIKDGTITFLYGEGIESAYSSKTIKDLDFTDSLRTKELRLTHNLIAGEGGFNQLMQIYDADPIIKLKSDFKKYIKSKSLVVDEHQTFGYLLETIEWLYKNGNNKEKSHLEVLLRNSENEKLYAYVKDKPFSDVVKMYWDKEQLLDDKIEIDGTVVKDVKRDALVKHLFKIQSIIVLYKQNNYRELLRKLDMQISYNDDKRNIYNMLEELLVIQNKTIGEVIEYASDKKICIKSDSFIRFVKKNDYLYWRVSNVSFNEFQNLYYYIEGRRPFSTQHKIKGLEYENVLVVLDNGGWNKYNFEYIFDDSIYDTLTSTRKKSFYKIKQRTEKLLYVCCTRAKERLVVFYPDPSKGVIEGAKKLFGSENCINLDES